MRARWSTMVVLTLVVLVVSLVARRARADVSGAHTVPVAVLSFDSEDAEDQADALTGALRSRIRASEGWSLMETSQSLGMLTAALKCPARPTPECQQRIGEQLKAERFIWGTVSRGPQAGQVTADVHLFQKGKPDTNVRESYADNLKDQNDDTLRKIAQRVIDRLAGNAVGAVVVRAPSDMNGEVIVDGDKKVPLVAGRARLELGPGSHSIEVIPEKGESEKRTMLVTAGKETVFEIKPAPPVAVTPEKTFPTGKVFGGVALGAGAALGALAVQQFLFWNDLQDRGDELAKTVPEGAAPCDPNTSEHFCNTDKRARTASAIAISSATLGAVAVGVGAYLLFIASDSSSERPTSAAKAKATRPKALLSPTLGPQGGGFALSGSF